MAPAEQAQEERRRLYLEEEARRKAAAKAREQERGSAAAQTAAMAWRRDLRSMQRYVGEHTAKLRGTPNAVSDGAIWTDIERSAEFRRLWRAGCVALVLGRRDDETLKLLNHPITHIPGQPGVERTELWKPRGDFVSVNTFVFDVLYSLIHNPVHTPRRTNVPGLPPTLTTSNPPLRFGMTSSPGSSTVA
jgi:hypothetical protein